MLHFESLFFHCFSWVHEVSPFDLDLNNISAQKRVLYLLFFGELLRSTLTRIQVNTELFTVSPCCPLGPQILLIF